MRWNPSENHFSDELVGEEREGRSSEKRKKEETDQLASFFVLCLSLEEKSNLRKGGHLKAFRKLSDELRSWSKGAVGVKGERGSEKG